METGELTKRIEYENYIQVGTKNKVQDLTVIVYDQGQEISFQGIHYEYYPTGVVQTKDIHYENLADPSKSYHRIYSYDEDGTLRTIEYLDMETGELTKAVYYNPDPSSLGIPPIRAYHISFPGKAYHYDENGNKISAFFFDENAELTKYILYQPQEAIKIPSKVNYYDGNSKLICVTFYLEEQGSVFVDSYITYSYDPDGKLQEKNYFGVTDETPYLEKQISYGYEYWGTGVLKTKDVECVDHIDPSKSYHKIYHYDEAGNLIGVKNYEDISNDQTMNNEMDSKYDVLNKKQTNDLPEGVSVDPTIKSDVLSTTQKAQPFQ